MTLRQAAEPRVQSGAARYLARIAWLWAVIAVFLVGSWAIVQAEQAAALSAPSGASDVEEARKLLAEVGANAAKASSVQAQFTQRKELVIFKQSMISKGRFAIAKGGYLLWMYESPVASGFVVEGETGRRWNAMTGAKEVFRLADDPIMQAVVDQLRIWSEVDVERLTRDYAVRILDRSRAYFELTPLQQTLRGFISHIRIRFNQQRSALEYVEVVEPRGDSTVITFDDIRFNLPRPAAPQ